MKVSIYGINLIKLFEDFREHAYQDIAGIWTVGFGSTMWQDGTRVKEGQTISFDRAESLLKWEVENKTVAIDSLTHKVNLTQNQFDALTSFTYNLGVAALSGSTLIKKVRINPNDLTIRDEFLRWNKARIKGELKIINGLTIRRMKEAEYYFS